MGCYAYFVLNAIKIPKIYMKKLLDKDKIVQSAWTNMVIRKCVNRKFEYTSAFTHKNVTSRVYAFTRICKMWRRFKIQRIFSDTTRF